MEINSMFNGFKKLKFFLSQIFVFKFLRKSLKGNQGIALLMAISFLVVMSLLVMEAARETVIEYSISSRKVSKIKSYYAAQAGMKLSLLRLNLYTTLLKKYGDYINNQNARQVDQIWSMPFNWPFSRSLPEEIPSSIKKKFKEVEEKSFLKATFSITIEPQSTLIDINNLGSDFKPLSQATKVLILSIFDKELSENKAFAEKYREFNFNQLVNNIADWIDYDDRSRNDGRNEFAAYDWDKRLHNEESIPPNQPFKILSELHMVKDMKDEFYELLVPHITLYGDMGFNINMPENIERLLNYQVFKPEVIEEIQQYLNSKDEGKQFFSSRKEFHDQFLKNADIDEEEGAIGDEEGITLKDFPFSFGFENFFKIISIGEYKGVSTQIIAHTSDLELNKKNLKPYWYRSAESAEISQGGPSESVSSENASSPQNPSNSQGQAPQSGSTTSTNTKRPLPTAGIPTIVYWREI